ncbi:hypothetical protein J4E80_002267 [Alternaria sp. BMP 0032]|nr:hypothetical protein J4E80_002267 [Alternaria sp. BMP 0032]
MLAWLTLLMGLSISLLFGATAATSAQFLSPEAQANRTAHGLQADVFTNSVQIILERYSIADFYWSLYLGPYGVKMNACKPGDFKLGSQIGDFDYDRNDIDNPPNPPATELPVPEWMGRKDCNWKTNGHGDVGQFVCGDWMIYDCERDASWNDGAISCTGQGWSYHRGYACNF